MKLLISLVIVQLVAVATSLAIPAIPEGGKLWAVLVAGSSTYDNYRHQADTCHAYQILHNHGIPDENIIVMMYDDIANSDENPTKGVIVNHVNGTDVYHNVPKDYTGHTVTPKNFLNVLTGNKTAMNGIGSGRVLESGPNDHVFINFADHGAPGILGFPEDELYVDDFIAALKTMHKNNMYNKTVLYVEACESGSMFKDVLPANINMYATTAANEEESSYACYWDDLRSTYLGDVYSVNWMEDSDAENLGSEKLSKQFEIVKRETNTSHVQQYGDLSIADLPVSGFQGEEEPAKTERLRKVPYDAVPAMDVPLHILQNKLDKMNENSLEAKETEKSLYKLKRNRVYLDEKVTEIVKKSVRNEQQVNLANNQRLPLHDIGCYNTVARYFSKECFALSKNEYALTKMYTFVNLCEMGIKSKAITKAMDLVCSHPPTFGIV